MIGERQRDLPTRADFTRSARVACFYVANSTLPDFAAPDWPRIPSVGYELPRLTLGILVAGATERRLAAG